MNIGQTLADQANSSVLIRAANGHDVPRLIALINGLASEAEMMFITRIDAESDCQALAQHVTEVAASAGHVLLVAETGPELIGFINASSQPYPGK